MMKKVIAAVLALILALSLTACNGKKKSASPSDLANKIEYAAERT